MAPDVAPIERLEDQPIALDPSAIEHEFARIWDESADAGDGAAVRLRVLNVVAVTADPEDERRFFDAMELMPQRHPCRGILVTRDPAASSVRAVISAHCWRAPGGRRQVCSEEVLLSGGAGQERELASAVLALLVPELPVTAWLLGPADLGSYLTSEVLEAADSVIYDSAREQDRARTLRLPLRVRGEHDVPCVDLAWARLTSWRSLAAQLFDGADGGRELGQITAIEVRGGGGWRSSEPLLLAAWFVSCLGLSLADVERGYDVLNATLYDGTRAVRLHVSSGASGAPVDELRIVTSDAEFNVTRHQESGHMHVRENWEGGASRRVVEQTPDDEPTLIVGLVDGAADVAVFESSLRTALALLGEEP